MLVSRAQPVYQLCVSGQPPQNPLCGELDRIIARCSGPLKVMIPPLNPSTLRGRGIVPRKSDTTEGIRESGIGHRFKCPVNWSILNQLAGLFSCLVAARGEIPVGPRLRVVPGGAVTAITSNSAAKK